MLPVDKALTRLFMASTFHHWKALPELARSCYNAGATVEEVRGCLRHLIVVCGYGPCLAATNHLHAAQLLPEDTPGKILGPPGNAFELVYGEVTAAVRKKLHNVDPVLAEYIRLHLYGDIYCSPGLSLCQKQLMMVSFLAEADMHEQLFGHLLAALRFNATKEACLKAIDIGFELSPRLASEAQNAVYKSALKTLELAYRKTKKDYPSGCPPEPEVFLPEPEYVRIPELYEGECLLPSSMPRTSLSTGAAAADMLTLPLSTSGVRSAIVMNGAAPAALGRSDAGFTERPTPPSIMQGADSLHTSCQGQEFRGWDGGSPCPTVPHLLEAPLSPPLGIAFHRLSSVKSPDGKVRISRVPMSSPVLKREAAPAG